MDGKENRFVTHSELQIVSSEAKADFESVSNDLDIFASEIRKAVSDLQRPNWSLIITCVSVVITCIGMAAVAVDYQFGSYESKMDEVIKRIDENVEEVSAEQSRLGAATMNVNIQVARLEQLVKGLKGNSND